MSAISNPRRILHLDGQWNTRESVREMIAKIGPGCELVSAECGATALKMIQKEAFDLVIVDPWAPTVTGFKICRYVVENKPATPVFFYTQRARMNDRKFAEASGAAAFFLADDHDGMVQAMASALAN